jgi:hypothetical protein
MKPNDTVYIRGHTGLWFGVKGQNELMCKQAARASTCAWVIESKVNALRHGSRIALRVGDQGGVQSRMRLGITANGDA